MPPDNLEFLRQSLFLASIVAGFSIAVAAQLVSLGNRGRVSSFAAASFLISSCLSIVATAGFALILTYATGAPGRHPLPLSTLIDAGIAMGQLAMLGLVALLVGVALTGWLHSRAVGLASTITASASFAAILLVILYLEGRSPP